MRGRRPTPLILRQLQGGKWRDRPQVALDDMPSCPSHLDEQAKAEWDRVAKGLWELGLLTDVDVACLAAYCQCYSRWVAIEELITQHGMLVGSKRHPLLVAEDSVLKQLKAFAVELGFTPSSRGRIELPPLPDGETDELDEFVGKDEG